MLKSLVILIIRLYQLLLSPILSGNCCRFNPSCSNYALEALKRFGFLKGMLMAVKRLLCCGTWYKSSEHCFFIEDSVPLKQDEKQKT